MEQLLDPFNQRFQNQLTRHITARAPGSNVSCELPNESSRQQGRMQ
jgi:hypothetical protein